MNTFPLRIYESDGIFFEGDAQSVTIPAEDGEYAVLAAHENTVVAVEPGILHYVTDEGELFYASVSNGMLRVEDGDVLVLVETAERPEEIDEERARRKEEEAREEMRAQKSRRDFYLAEAMLRRELARLKLLKDHGNNL
ncbi:MAG: ATP synthase F1 subunit epsilon [Lachnospiraceae bacterium]|nr:ATP synthase F1 subunit epsilon [Lachnospiraceae bacterium]